MPKKREKDGVPQRERETRTEAREVFSVVLHTHTLWTERLSCLERNGLKFHMELREREGERELVGKSQEDR